MNTITLPILKHWTTNVSTNCTAGQNIPICKDIGLFDQNITSFSSDTLYIGNQRDYTLLTKKELNIPNTGIIMLLADCGNKKIKSRDKNLTIITTNTTIIDLYNIVNENKKQFDIWLNNLDSIAKSSNDIQALVDEAAKLIVPTIMISGADLKPRGVHLQTGLDDAIINEIRSLGHQTYETIKRFGPKQHKRDTVNTRFGIEYIEYVSEDNNYRRIFMVKSQNDYVARVGIIFSGPEYDEYYLDLALLLSKFVSDLMITNNMKYTVMSTSFACFFADLVENKLTDISEIYSIAKQFGFLNYSRYKLIVLSFPYVQNISILPVNIIIVQLKDIFHPLDVTIFNNNIVLVLEDTNSDYHELHNKLHELLKAYRGFGCIGKGFSGLNLIPVYYSQALDIISIGSKVDTDVLIYNTDDYLEFNFIEKVLESNIMKFNADKMVLTMCRDEVLKIRDHDKENNDNLFETLYVYLSCFSNVNESARRMYLHRNSMNKRITKIENLIGKTLDDTDMCAKLLFSCKIIDYANHISRP